MVATFDVIFDNGGVDGAAANQTDVDALGPPCIRFKNADDSTIDANDKIIIPAAGTKYSFWKQLCICCSAADGHSMNNFAVYSDGANSLGAGIDVKIGLTFPDRNAASDDTYELPAADEEMDDHHSGVTGIASIFDYSAGEATDLDITCSEAGNLINAANETTDYIVLQMEVTNAAAPGDLTNETGTFSYDEA
jgi:hypothetical protein